MRRPSIQRAGRGVHDFRCDDDLTRLYPLGVAALTMSAFGAFWVALGLMILWTDVRAFRRAGPLRRRRTCVADLQDGAAAKVVGRVRLGTTFFRAPLSGRRCAGWQVDTAQRKLWRWRPVATATEVAGFYLDDGTGEIYVPLDRRAELQLCIQARARVGRGRNATRAVESLVEGSLGEALSSTYRCDERALTDGQRIAVYGIFHRTPDSRPSEARDYRGRAYQFVATLEADEPVRISDDRSTLD